MYSKRQFSGGDFDECDTICNIFMNMTGVFLKVYRAHLEDFVDRGPTMIVLVALLIPGSMD